MRLLTGSDLASGDVVWWAGAGWSRAIADAADVGEGGEALGQAEERARRVTGPYVIEATATPDGPRPAHIKDRIRAAGPTIRYDAAHAPAELARVI